MIRVRRSETRLSSGHACVVTDHAEEAERCNGRKCGEEILEPTVHALEVLDDGQGTNHRNGAQVLGRRFQDISLAEPLFGRVQACTSEVLGRITVCLVPFSRGPRRFGHGLY